MEEFFIVILSWMVVIGLFVIYNKYHKYLNNAWENNRQYFQDGNEGKRLFLLQVDGIGFSLYGKYRDTLIGDYKTYVTYHVFCFLHIPILPLGCYRVVKENGGYRILGGEKMAWREILCMFLGVIKWAVAFVVLLGLLILLLPLVLK